MATTKPRYTVSVDEEMFKKIEDFRFEGRYPTRSEATVELIRLGLEVHEMQRETAQDSRPVIRAAARGGAGKIEAEAPADPEELLNELDAAAAQSQMQTEEL